MNYKGKKYTVEFHPPIITQENFKEKVQEVLDELKAIGVRIETTVYDYKLELNERALSRFGQCSKKTRYRKDYYTIQINNFHNMIDSETEVKNTLVHEIIHSMPNCMNHGEVWKRIALKYSRAYGIDIARTNRHEKYSQFRKEYEAQKTNSAGEIIGTNKYKYAVTCTCCGKEWKYQKRSKIVELAYKGKKLECPYCKGRYGATEFTARAI